MVQCKGCGCVAMLDRVATRYCELDERARVSGGLPDNMVRRHDTDLVCLALAHPLNKEFRPAANVNNEHKVLLEVLERDRDCSAFTPWVPGFSPKEHIEMRLLQLSRESEDRKARELREWQAEQRKADLERQERQRKEDQERHERQRKEDQDYRRKDTLHKWLLAGLAALVSWAVTYLNKSQPPAPIVIQPVTQPTK